MSEKVKLKIGVSYHTANGSDYKLSDVEKPNRRARKQILKEHKKNNKK